MVSNTVRALGVALLLGAAIAGPGSLSLSVPVEAAARPQVGKALQEAIRLAGSGNMSAANEKVKEAESMGGLTPGDQQAIEQTKNYIAAKGGSGGGAGARIKFVNDYNAGHYKDVVGPDADELRKSGGFSGDDSLIVAQAYYLMGDNASAIHLLHNMHSEQALTLLMNAAIKANDTASVRDAEEQLVVTYNQPKYWTYLLQNADSTPGMSPENTMDVYRIRLLTGSMRNQDDYMTAAEVAIQIGCPTEAQAIVQNGITAKVLVSNDPSNRIGRLLNMAKTQSTAEQASMANEAQAADKAKTGDASIKLAGQYWGMTQYQQALDAAKAGVAKGTSDDALAQIRLGMAYVGLHQKDGAVRAFNQAVKIATKPGDTAVAHLWLDYAKTH
jgi:tetratricopeptide (TPR) repeat protein